MKTLKEVFDTHFKDVSFDMKMSNEIKQFITQFFTKNSDHVDFFGGNLLGVHQVRWNYSDTDCWWDEIFGVVEELLHDDMLKLPSIRADWKVSSNTLNQAFIYALHRTHHSKQLPEAEKEQMKIRIMLAMNVRFITSLMAGYFRHPADPGVAEKTFNKLTKRFDLKTTGSWGKMLLERSKDLVKKGARYYNTYVDYDNDVEIIKMVNGVQTRIRDTFKEIVEVYYETLYENAKVLSSSSSVELDGTLILKDIQRKGAEYNRYIKNTISTGDGFIKNSLVEVIYQAVPSLQPGVFEEILKYTIDGYTDVKRQKVFNDLIDNLLTYSFDLLKENDIAHNDLPGVLYRLKHVYMSGRVTDPQLDKCRQLFTKVIEGYDRKLKNTPLVSERCAYFLYIVLRTLTMKYYK